MEQTKKEFWEALSQDHEKLKIERISMEIMENLLSYPTLITEWQQNRHLAKQLIDHYEMLTEIDVFKTPNYDYHVIFRFSNGFECSRVINERMLYERKIR